MNRADSPPAIAPVAVGHGAPCESQMQAERSALRVLHGLTEAAGQPWTISRAQRRLGHAADCVRISNSRFGYDTDWSVNVDGDPFDAYSRLIIDASSKYDVFHFYFRPILYFDTQLLLYPTAMDLLALRAAGKTLFFHYRGSEVRLPSVFKAKSPFNYVDEDPQDLVTNFPEPSVKALMGFVRGVCHKVLVPDPELQTYVPFAEIVPRAVDLSQWTEVGPVSEDDPLVVHAPSRRAVKGTPHVIEAVNALRAEGMRFRFELIEEMDNAAARRRYAESDIIIDQLRIGWYGVLAVEGMALGKAVVSYIRDDLAHHLGPQPPLAIANPETIKDVLRRLIADAAWRRDLGRRGREFCEQTHDADRIAARLVQMYEHARRNPLPLDMQAVLEFIRFQKQTIEQGGLRRAYKPGIYRRTRRALRQYGFRHVARKAWERIRTLDFR